MSLANSIIPQAAGDWQRADASSSIQFNVVSKGLGSERMSFFLNEAAGDVRDLLLPTLELPKPKL